MNRCSRILSRSAIAVVLFVCSTLAHAQDPVLVRNDMYDHGVRMVGDVRLYVVEGFAPTTNDEVGIPRRIVRIPVDERAPFDVRLAQVSTGEPITASPFYRYDISMAADSSMRSRLVPADAPLAQRQGMVGEILSKRYSREHGALELVLELPLLTWDPTAMAVQWIESYTFERITADGFIGNNFAAAVGRPPYASQPFTTRSRNVDTSQTWIDMGNPMLRFFVRQDGLYKITGEWMRESGMDPASIDPGKIQLYRKGETVPLYLYGMEDGRFDDGDYMLLYGTRNYDELGHRRIPDNPDDPCPQYMSLYTDSTAYWFHFNSPAVVRINSLDLRSQGVTDTLDWAYKMVHMEYENHLWCYATSIVKAQMPDWSSEDSYFGGEFRPGGVVRDRFTADNLNFAKPARYWAKGASWFGDASVSPNHSLTLAVNTSGTLDSVAFSLNEQRLLYAEFPSTLLFNGIDTVKLISHNVQGGGSSSVALDWLEVEYPRYLLADGRQLIFNSDVNMSLTPQVIKVQSSLDGEMYCVRIGDENSVILPLLQKQQGAPSAYLFVDSLLSKSTYVFCPADSVLVPARGERRVIEPLVTPNDEAAYLIVTCDELKTSSLEYADFITQSYGVSTKVVSVEDIYDVYSYGMFQPEAIKLLTFDARYTWASDSLRYLLLIGDASYNYKSTTSKYSRNLVPSYGNPVSDIWFSCFDTLQIQVSLPVGRLSARTEDDVRAYQRKHEAYLVQPMDLWNKSSLHFSGGNPNGGTAELLKFKGINQLVIDHVVTPREFSGLATHFYKTLNPQSDFGPYPESFVSERIKEGGIFISYVGHSGTATWDNSISSPSQIENGSGKGTLVTDFGCSTGRFAEVDIVSFSEASVVGQEGQSIGYIGNASAGFESTTAILPFLYYSALIRDRAVSVGAAHIASKKTLKDMYGNSSVNIVSTLTNLLIGDPIIKIKLPEKPNLVVKDQWMRVLEEIITDQMDSIRCTMVLGNWGLHSVDSVDLLLEHQFLGQPRSSELRRVAVPDVYDTLQFIVPLTGESGRGVTIVTIDPDNLIDEIYENDNSATLSYEVYSTFMKVVDERQTITRGGSDLIRVLNPALAPAAISGMIVEYDTSPDFSSPVQRRNDYGKTMTMAPWNPDPSTGPVYWRARLEGTGNDQIGPFKRYPSIDGDFIQADSADFLHADLVETRIHNNSITLMPSEVVVQAESAGFPWKFGAVRVNGINILKSTFFRGYAIAVFDSLTMKLLRTGQFDTWGNGSAPDSVRVWIEGVQTGEIVAVTTADEPRSGSGTFSAAMKSIGSALIDSVRISDRCSYAIIGHKGAAEGSVPEGFKRQSPDAIVVIQQSFNVLPDTGRALTPLIGPATQWQTAALARTDAAVSDIGVNVLGTDTSGNEALLIQAGNTTLIDLSSVDASRYPHIRLAATLAPGGSVVPEIGSWSVAYLQPAELALNYQSVMVLRDSVIQAEPIELSIGLLNAGESAARGVPLQVEIIGSDNIPRIVTTFEVMHIAPRAWFDSTIQIPTDALTGAYQIRVIADKAGTILEQFEDNNSFLTSFFVKADTTRPQMDITFDGYLPVHGDYIRYNPEIVLTLHTPPPFPIVEKEKFRVTIDGDALSLDSLSASFTPASATTPAVLRFQPNLADGEYYFGFNATDGNDQKVYEEDLEILVRVSSQSRIAEMYNYPNPFAGETSFTFLLTGAGVPDEVLVKVYTVAGRLIRTLSFPPSAVRIGYNALKWDGKDEDGDNIANGVYFFKLISKFSDTTVEEIGRMAVQK